MNHASKDHLLSRISAEFSSRDMETSFLCFSWKDNRCVTRSTFLGVAFLFAIFFIRDVLELENNETVYLLLFSRVAVCLFILASLIIVQRADNYFSRYRYLLFVNQMVIAIAIFILAVLREMPFAYLGVNTILFTFVNYQLLNNRFYLTVTASMLLGLGAIATGLYFLNMNMSDLLASFLFLIPLNVLGMIILRSNNRSKRREYTALLDLKGSNDEKEKAIDELREAFDEVKALRGLLPICANCKKIRDDKGYWNQIESYIEKHSDARFSHGMCQDCAEELYGHTSWYQKLSK